MDKLSIYEALSYLVPGYLAAKIVEYYFTFYGIAYPFPIDAKLDDSILSLVLAIILGLSIHVFTFWCNENWDWYKNKVYFEEVEHVKSSSKLLTILPQLNKYYHIDRTHTEEEIDIDEKNKYGKFTFDFTYYYLEVNDKITQAKNFQSFYFLFRNLFTVSLIHFGWLLIAFIIGFTNSLYSIWNLESFMMVVTLLINTILIVLISRWLRGKMIDRVLWSYYIDRRISDVDNKNK